MLICLQLCWIVFWLEQWNLLNFKLSWVCFEVLWQDRPYNWDQSLKKKPIFEDKLGIIDGTYQNFPKLITRIIMIILLLFYLINLYLTKSAKTDTDISFQECLFCSILIRICVNRANVTHFSDVKNALYVSSAKVKKQV